MTNKNSLSVDWQTPRHWCNSLKICAEMGRWVGLFFTPQQDDDDNNDTYMTPKGGLKNKCCLQH